MSFLANFQDSADYVIKILATDGVNTNKTESGRFSIINSPGKHFWNTTNGSNAFIGYDGGNIFLKGTCSNETTCMAPSHSLRIGNLSGDVVAYFDTDTGDLCIESSTSCEDSDEQSSCTSPNPSIIYQDDGEEVIVIDRVTGNLCLIGKIYENLEEVP